MRIDIIIHTTRTSGKEYTQTISHISSEATNESIRNLATYLIGLTSQTYNYTEKKTLEEVIV